MTRKEQVNVGTVRVVRPNHDDYQITARYAERVLEQIDRLWLRDLDALWYIRVNGSTGEESLRKDGELVPIAFNKTGRSWLQEKEVRENGD